MHNVVPGEVWIGYRKNLFIEKVVKHWNTTGVVESPSLEEFQSSVDVVLRDMDQ